MRLQYIGESNNKLEWHDISIEDFFNMDPETFTGLGITDIKTSLTEKRKLKEKYHQELETLNRILEQHGLPRKEAAKKNIEDAYISLCGELSNYREIDAQVEVSRDEFDQKQRLDLEDHQRRAEEEKNQLRLRQEREIAEIDRNIRATETRKATEERDLAKMREELANKEARLEELKQRKAELEATLPEVSSPENLTRAYIECVHQNLDESIGNVRGKVTGSKTQHRLWVTNGAPVDKNGNPMTTFNEDGIVVGTPHAKLFPDMQIGGMYGASYCTAAVMSCIGGVDRQCGVEIVNTNPFPVDTEDGQEQVTPYISGYYNEKTGETKSETTTYRPDLLHICYSDTTYVSGVTGIQEQCLYTRPDGSKAVDKRNNKNTMDKVDVNTLQVDKSSTISTIYKPENKQTDENTGEIYYKYGDNYIKDGDIICLKLHSDGHNTNNSGFHTIMVNVDQETGKMTFTAGNADYVKSEIPQSFAEAPAAIFHTSEFAHDKIASFDEETRQQMAQNLGIYDGTQYDEEIAALEAEIAADKRLISEKDAEVKNSTVVAQSLQEEKDNLLRAHEQQNQDLAQQQAENLRDFQQEQSAERTSFEEKIESAYRAFYENGEVNLENLLHDFFISNREEEEDLLFGSLKQDRDRYEHLAAALIQNEPEPYVQEDNSIAQGHAPVLPMMRRDGGRS